MLKCIAVTLKCNRSQAIHLKDIFNILTVVIVKIVVEAVDVAKWRQNFFILTFFFHFLLSKVNFLLAKIKDN